MYQFLVLVSGEKFNIMLNTQITKRLMEFISNDPSRHMLWCDLTLIAKGQQWSLPTIHNLRSSLRTNRILIFVKTIQNITFLFPKNTKSFFLHSNIESVLNSYHLKSLHGYLHPIHKSNSFSYYNANCSLS